MLIFIERLMFVKKKLKKQSVSEEQINTLVSLQLHQDFQEYLNELSNRVSDKEQLSKIVSMKLISLVERFITRVSSELAINYQRKYSLWVMSAY